MRHTAFELFSSATHKSYFFNLFHQKALRMFLDSLKGEPVDLIENRREAFEQKKYTYQWQKGDLTNFEYICLINRYSGRTVNDLAQYPVMPWVLVNFKTTDN